MKSPRNAPTAHCRAALKSVPSLQLSNNVLIDALSGGYGYDTESVASLVNEGNRLFEQRNLNKAADTFAAAYEIARSHYVYPPLLHDLVLRRVLCLSMTGHFERALFEVDIAFQIVPHAPTLYLVSGIIYAKMHRADEANHALQRAVQQCALLRDTVECIVAMLLQARDHCDHAIHKTTEILKRSPFFVAALLARGEAYRHHASGYFNKQADADFNKLLQQDARLQALVEHRFTLENHALIDERLLWLHPWLSKQGPKPYQEYEMYHRHRITKGQPVFLTSLICYAVAKMRVLVRSSHLVRSVRQRHEELLQQRAAAERRMQELVEAQRGFAQYEQHSEVWGPADPDNQIVRKYRRYWMERPTSFPHRHDSKDALRQFSVDQIPAVSGEAGKSPSSAAHPQGIAPAPAVPIAWQKISNDCHAKCAVDSIEPRDMNFIEERFQQDLQAPVPALAAHSSRQTDIIKQSAPSPPLIEFMSPEVASTSISASATYTSREPPTLAATTVVDVPLPKKIGADWSDHQWFLKAIELCDDFSKNSGAHAPLNLGIAPSCSPPDLPDHEPCRNQTPPPPSKIVRVRDGQEDNLIAVVEKEGIDGIPNWFSTLDRIYTITDMALFSSKPESFVGDANLAGAPGYSYVVHKSSSQKKRAPSSEDEEAKAKADEALVRRYQNKLLVTSLHGRTSVG